MKTLNRLLPSSVLLFFWVTLSRLPVLAQEATEESAEETPKAPVDLDPQLTEGADQVTEATEKLGLSNIPYASFLISLGATVVVSLLFYYIVFAILRAIFRRFKSDLPLVALGTARRPITLILVALGLSISFNTLPEQLNENILIQLMQKLFLASVVLAIAHLINQLLVKVVLYAARQFAESSEALWDDVLIPFVETTAPIAIYLAGIAFALQTTGIDLTGLWVTFGGAAFVLGFAVKDILANFFSGLVLLIDTPFRFGEVVLCEGERAIVRKIGLRTTKLYLIETHSDVFVPNSVMQGKSIVNLSRPTSHYYYTVSLDLPTDVNPQRASKLMQEVVLAHPDTIGTIDHKLAVLDRYFGYSGFQLDVDEKRETGRLRLELENSLNKILATVEDKISQLKYKIKRLEQGGLDADEIQEIKTDFLHICDLSGLSPHIQPGPIRGERSVLEEDENAAYDALVPALKGWYQAWLKDPDLVQEDKELLPQKWEQKLVSLKNRFSSFYEVVLNPEGQETRLDDYLEEIEFWLQDSFKSSRNEWQEPKVWFDEKYTVKFYIDDIALEHGQRGNRIQSEIRREMMWHLRQAYLLR
jgi:MscS family membrane protein